MPRIGSGKYWISEIGPFIYVKNSRAARSEWYPRYILSAR